MFRPTKKGPDRAFSHAEGCKILAADPTVSIEWSEVERGHWQAVCQCGAENYYEPTAARVRLDPLDPKPAVTWGNASSQSSPIRPSFEST
jgi:hypothetical protein